MNWRSILHKKGRDSEIAGSGNRIDRVDAGWFDVHWCVDLEVAIFYCRSSSGFLLLLLSLIVHMNGLSEVGNFYDQAIDAVRCRCFLEKQLNRWYVPYGASKGTCS